MFARVCVALLLPAFLWQGLLGCSGHHGEQCASQHSHAESVHAHADVHVHADGSTHGEHAKVPRPAHSTPTPQQTDHCKVCVWMGVALPGVSAAARSFGGESDIWFVVFERPRLVIAGMTARFSGNSASGSPPAAQPQALNSVWLI